MGWGRHTVCDWVTQLWRVSDPTFLSRDCPHLIMRAQLLSSIIEFLTSTLSMTGAVVIDTLLQP